MAGLSNSQRRIPKATYVPRTLPAAAQAASGRAVEKSAFLLSLKIDHNDLAAITGNAVAKKLMVPAAGKQPAQPLTDLVKEFVALPPASALKRFGPALARTPAADIAALGEAVAKGRSQAAADLRRAAQKVARAAPVAAAPAAAAPPSGGQARGALAAASAAAQLPLDSPILANIADLQDSADQASQAVNQFNYQAPLSPVGQIYLERMEMTPVGVEHGELVHSIPLTPGETVNVSHREWSQSTQSYETLTMESLEGFSETGVAEKHDLSSSSDIENKHSSSLDVSGSISATYNGGAYSLTASAAVAYGSKDENQTSEKSSVAHSMAVTRTASTRTKKEHQLSFRVASAAGTEDMAVQVITNSNPTDAMRVDYYQLLRKWRVDLIRYGLRMTYDLVIPNPGLGLVQKLMELEDLNEQLLAGNVFTLDPTAITTGNWTDFEKEYGVVIDPPPVPSIQMMRTATVPGQTYDKWGNATVEFDVPDGYAISSAHFRGLFSLYNYESDGRHLQVRVQGEPLGTSNSPTGEYEGKDYIMDIDLTSSTLVGRTGQAFLVFEYHNVDYGDATVSIVAAPTSEALQSWQAKAWSQLHDANQANYDAKMTLARNRVAELQAEIDAFDALTLRKMEREEIMKGVIQWMLGPHFALMPDDLAASIAAHVDDSEAKPGSFAFPSVQDLSEAEWHSFLDHGELIKFLHNAIEWENVIFFAYPYFWDRAENSDFKRFLMHPDPTHREFLRAGCARVVLPVRPGFETSFAMLMETGDGTAAPDTNYPYVSIGQEVRDFAMTNYEAIPPANPDNNVRTLLYPIQRSAWAQIQDIMKALAQCFADNGSYPSNLADAKLAAAATKAGVTIAAKDPFGAAWQYRSPGIFGDFDLWSAGDSTQPNVDGLDGQINSWAEGSVIGRWYEYTPTSALDVAISMIKVDQTKLTTQPSPA